MKRYALYLAHCPQKDIPLMPEIKKRVDNVRAWRLAAKRMQTQKFAKIPHLYGEERISDEQYLAFPYPSSERRYYIPIDFIDGGVVAGRGIQIVENVSLFPFGILTSAMHMAWMREVCGRMGQNFRYSSGIVYNNFIWPESGHEEEITQAATHVLETRKPYLESGKNLAWLYNPETMPTEWFTHRRTYSLCRSMML